MTGNWIESFKPLFTEIYGWNPDENNKFNDYLYCLFNKLLEIHLKIVHDMSGNDLQLKQIFNACFDKRLLNDADSTIERAINCLSGLIQNNQVIVNDIERYSLKLSENNN